MISDDDSGAAPDDDEIDIELRSVEEIGQRLIALTAVADRFGIEREFGEIPSESKYELETERFDLFSWARKELTTYVTPHEMAFLKTPFGKCDLELVVEMGFAIEQAVALAWVLDIVVSKHLEMPPTTAFVHQHQLLDRWRPKPWDRPDRKLRKLKLRSEQAIWDERDRLSSARLWRMVADADEAENASEIASLTALLHAAGYFEDYPDFFPSAESLAIIDEGARDAAILSIGAVVKALTWACGFGASWDDIPWDDPDVLHDVDE